MTAISWNPDRLQIIPRGRLPRLLEVEAPPPKNSSGELLGAGRSGRVYRLGAGHRSVARKVFFGEFATHTVHYLFFGAPNPYIWNADAVASAYYRRRILAQLVRVWFGDRLQVANATGMGWDAAERAYFLDTEFVTGRPVALRQPFNPRGDHELEAQLNGVMRPLQQHLQASGFDGLLWQVGKGNPSALNNLLLTAAADRHSHFAWIDLESGVPALFPLNLVTLLRFYLPQALRRGRALFDDVDIPSLQRYLAQQRAWLLATLGPEECARLDDEVNRLADHQARWKHLGRTAASIQYQVARGRLSEAEGEAALANPLGWYASQLGQLMAAGVRVSLHLPQRVLRALGRVPYGQILRTVWQSCLSHRYRLALARGYVTQRILAWERRGQISRPEAAQLERQLYRNGSSDYLSDFCVHLALKLPIKALRFTLFPALFGLGVINAATLALLLAVGGMVVRQLYTLFRMVEAALNGQPIPWVAFGAGLIPFLSNVAYACQMVYAATRRRPDTIAQFMLYDSFTRLGSWVPAWGGKDTLVEHWFNQIAHGLIHALRRLGGQVDDRRLGQP